MIRKTLLILSFYFLSISLVFAQSYITTLGVRVGDNTDFRMAGLSFQQVVLKKVTLEGILQSDFQKNTTLHLLAESHQNIISKRLNFYVGAGLSGGFEEFSQKSQPTQQNKTFGADIIAGLEVTLLHWNISLDYKPNFNIYGRESWYQGQVGISVRRVIISDAAIQKHKREKAREQRQKKREKEREKRLENSKEKPRFEDVLKDLFKN
jgi:hypothetical protein